MHADSGLWQTLVDFVGIVFKRSLERALSGSYEKYREILVVLKILLF